MIAGLKTGPCGDSLKELRLCSLSTKVLRGDLVTANTEMIWGAEDLSSLLDWKAGRCRSHAAMNRSMKLLKEEVSASLLHVLKSSVEVLVQHLLWTAVTAAFTDSLSRGQWMKWRRGEQRRSDKVRQQPALPPWMKRSPQGGVVSNVSTWTLRKCSFGATH